MMKYQEPEMVVIKFMWSDVITASSETLYPSPDKDENGSSVGGGGSTGWDGF